MPTVGQRLVAECVGTFALVFAGCGAIMVDARTHALGHLGVALSFGLVIMIMISALGHISGAHFNPAVTAGFALGRHFPLRLVLPYWAAQLGGALAAALLLRASLGHDGGIGAATPSGSDGQAFLWETVLTAFLMLVILAVATDTRAQGQLAALAIGGTVGLDALFGGPITGASMNPARSLAPAIAGGPSAGLWIYLAAPLVGAAASTLLYHYLALREPAALSA
jgi:aquaporin NIP